MQTDLKQMSYLMCLENLNDSLAALCFSRIVQSWEATRLRCGPLTPHTRLRCGPLTPGPGGAEKPG